VTLVASPRCARAPGRDRQLARGASSLTDGESIVIACRGELGRTGTVVGCLLRDAALDGPAAIALTGASRNKTIETAERERFVTSWGDS
jgi:protein-tyrosine phosphatase